MGCNERLSHLELFFFFQAEDGIRDLTVTGVQTCALPIYDALAQLRDKTTPPDVFRRLATRISVLLAAEALRDVPVATSTVETPIGPAEARRVAADVVVVPVLRAGLGMLDAVLDLVPSARVGYIGLQRDEATAVASQYYSKLPRGLMNSYVLMIDPILATGGSASAALELLWQAGALR